MDNWAPMKIKQNHVVQLNIQCYTILCHYYAQHKSCGFIHVWNERGGGGPDSLDPPLPKSASDISYLIEELLNRNIRFNLF